MEALKEGSVIMVIGMSTVFIFLVIMIFAMNICAKIIQVLNKYFPESINDGASNKNSKINKEKDAEVALAIACAIQKKKQG